MNEKIRVLLCDDQPLIRKQLRRVLEGTPDFQVVGEATGGWDGVRLTRALAPAVVVMDLAMPDLDGIEATRQICSLTPGVRVVIFSASCSAQTAQRALAAGAMGCLSKSSPVQEFLEALRTVMRGLRYISPAITHPPTQANHAAAKPPGPEAAWPPRGPGPVRVLLVDDAPAVRERLAELVSAVDGVRVVGQAADLSTAARLLQEHQPTVLVLDLDLGGQNGLDLLSQLPEGSQRPVTIVLTNHDYRVLRELCTRQGADFYFYKPLEFERVAEVCRQLSCGAADRGGD